MGDSGGLIGYPGSRLAHSRDAIAQFLLPREDWRATTFAFDGREHLRHVVVASTDVAAYRALLAPGGAS